MTLPCPVCATVSPEVDRFDDIHLYRCPVCAHRFTDPKQLAVMEEYRQDYYDEQHKNWNLHPDFALFDTISLALKELRLDASVVDIGCGRANFLHHLRKKSPGFSLTGLDVSSQSLNDGIEFIQGDILNVALPKKVDAIVSLAVIEHVLDISKFVSKCRDALVPGGLLVTMTLNDKSILYATARLLRQFGMSGPYKQLYSRHHLHHFNNASLAGLLERNGFEVTMIHHHNIPIAAADVSKEGGLKEKFLRLGVWGTFILGQLTGRTYLQTIFSRKKSPC